MTRSDISAVSVWSAFRGSGKRHLILTGGRGSGKTTLLGRLCPNPLPGITTWAVPREAVYMRENSTGKAVRIGIYDDTLPGRTNKMRPLTDEIEAFGTAALEKCAEDGGEWVSIDEIGYLEADCPAYKAALRHLMQKKRLIAAVRAQALPFPDEIRNAEDVFTVNLDAPLGNLGCVIMASGVGRRFGGNKLLADFRGEPMILRALAATEGIFTRRVLVTRHADVAALCRARGADVILHNLPERSDTVRLGIAEMAGTDGCLFCPGDQPLLRRETVMALALAAADAPQFIRRAAFGEEVGAPVLFPCGLYGELSALPDGKGGGYVIKKHPALLRTVQAQDSFELMDADTPEDLARLSVLR